MLDLPRALLALCLLLVPLAAVAAGARAEEREMMLGLADGGVLWGSVVAHDEDGVVFHRLDNGGRVELSWDLLDPRFEERLRERLGYLDVADEEVMVKADLLRTVEGGEIVGLIVHESEGVLHVKTANALLAVPKVRIAGPSTLVSVPALEVYTRPELYQRERTARAADLAAEGEAGAAAHFELAQFCERILDYGNAVAHYARAQELAPAYRPSDVAVALARAERKAAAQEQVDALGEIRRERQRRNYDRALELVAAFPERFPASPLFEELYALRRSVERARHADLVESVERLWHRFARRLVDREARNEDFAAARTWVEERMGDEVLAAVHAELALSNPGLSPADVAELWQARSKRRTYHASYGVGTFLLGDAEARAGLEEEETADEGRPSARDAAREDLERRIRRFLEQQRGASSSTRASGAEVDPAEFWRRWSVSGREQWLLARYAEQGGDVEVRGIHFRTCRECGGTGVREVIYAGPARSGASADASRRLTCPTCQHVGIVRRVSYR